MHDLSIILEPMVDFPQQDLLLRESGPDAVLLFFSIRDIDNGGEHLGPVLGFHGIETNLNRKFAAILAKGIEIPSRAHRPWTWIGYEDRPQCRVMPTKPLRYKHLDRVTQHLLPPITEHSLRLGVDHFNPRIHVGHHHGIRRGLNRLAKETFQVSLPKLGLE